MSVHESSRFLSADAVAVLFGRTRRTVYRWLKKHQIVGQKIGGRFYFRREDIDRLISSVDRIDTSVPEKEEPPIC